MANSAFHALLDHHVPNSGSLGALVGGADVLLRELSYPAVVDASDRQSEGDGVLSALNISRERWDERASSIGESFSELLSSRRPGGLSRPRVRDRVEGPTPFVLAGEAPVLPGLAVRQIAAHDRTALGHHGLSGQSPMRHG